MTDTYMFADSVQGLRLMLSLTLSLRRVGFSTRTHTERCAGFTLHVLTATPKARLSRKERGL